jgi:Rrf2 family protein
MQAMQLGRASAYGVFATVYIASHQEHGPVQGRDIADAYGVPPEYLLKILQRLVRGRVLRSERGRGGGFKLRKTAHQTTMLEIVEAIDGPVDGELTVRQEIRGAKKAKNLIEANCTKIARFTRSLLSKTTIQQLMR